MASPLFLAILFKNAGHESWIPAIVGAALGFVVSYMIMTLYNLNKGKELAGICKAAFGKTAGIFFAVLYLLFFFFHLCSNVSQVSEFLSTYVLPETPIPVIIALLVVACTVSARRKSGPLCGMAFWLFLLVSGYTVLSVFFLQDKMNPENFLPVLSLDGGSYVKSAVTTVAELFSGLTIFLVFFNEEGGNDNLRKPVLIGYLLAAAIIVLAALRDCAVFGPFSKYLTAPSLQSARMISFGEILSRVELLYVLLFVCVIFFKFSLSIYAISKLFSSVTGCGRNYAYVWPVGILLFGVSIVSFRSYADLLDWGESYMPLYIWLFEVILPAVMLLICAVKLGVRNMKIRAAGVLGLKQAEAGQPPETGKDGNSENAEMPENAEAQNDAFEKKSRLCFTWTLTSCILITGVIAVLLLFGVRVPSPFTVFIWIAKSIYRIFGF